MARARSDLLQITLFKDHESARSLQVPIAWIRRLALIALGLVFSVAMISLIALREFRAARRFDPSRVVDLERQVSELREAAELTASTAVPTEDPVGPVPLKELPPFVIEDPKMELLEGKLKIQLSLKYAKADGRSQNGTLVFLVQTATALFSYPEGLVSSTPEGELELLVQKGERFSVAKLRETTATVTLNTPAASIGSVSLLLFGPDQKLLQKESLDVSTLSAPR